MRETIDFSTSLKKKRIFLIQHKIVENLYLIIMSEK